MSWCDAPFLTMGGLDDLLNEIQPREHEHELLHGVEGLVFSLVGLRSRVGAMFAHDYEDLARVAQGDDGPGGTLFELPIDQELAQRLLFHLGKTPEQVIEDGKLSNDPDPASAP